LRALIYRAGEALVAGEDVTRLAAIAKPESKVNDS
jgi:hypothetical protein